MSQPTSGSFELRLSTPELIALLCALLEHLNSRQEQRDAYRELLEQLILKLQDALDDDDELAALARQSGGGGAQSPATRLRHGRKPT